MNRLRSCLLPVFALAAFALPCAAQAQAGTPPPGKALVVLYRADKQPVAGKVPVIANADRLGELGDKEFINAVVNPGKTFLRAGDRILTTLSLQTSAGQTYYVLLEAVPGQSPLRVEMREMTQGAARNALAQSRAAAPAAALAAAAAAAPRPAAPAPAAPAPAARPGAPAQAAATPAPPRPAPAAAPPPPRPAQAPTTTKPAPPPPSTPAREPSENEEAKFALIVKTGAFKLSTPNQTLGGLPSTYDKTSKPFAALELEYRDPEGYALGGEILYYKNDFTPDGLSLKGEQKVMSGMLNVKYYLETKSWLYPFVGVGLGYAQASFGGDFSGKTSGFAFQAMTGADIRFSENMGLYLEFKYLSAPTRDSKKQEVTVGGTGFIAGLSFAF